MHNIFGDIINPYILNLLAKNNQTSILKKVFDFFEEMVKSSDVEIENVLIVTVLERIGDDKAILCKSYNYMGERTRKISDEIEKYWGRI